MRRVEFANLHTGCCQFIDKFFIHLGTAHPVQQQMHLDAPACPLGQRIRKLSANVARPVDVGLKRDGFLRAADGGQHGRKYLVAIAQHLMPVAANERRPQQHAQLMHEARVFQRIEALDPMLDFLLALHEIDDQQHAGNGGGYHCRGQQIGVSEFDGTWHFLFGEMALP